MKWRLVMAALAITFAAGKVHAAPEPVLKTSLEKDTAIPGQPLLFRITVLVPTFMPQPPVFPNFEVPNVLVRLPSGASGPTSERIDGETWSGIARSYRLYPMAAGVFQIPAGTVKITYADPEGSEAVKVDLSTQSFEITGAVPPGTEKLSPFLAATSLELERNQDVDPSTLTTGAALTLTSTATVSGVPAMSVPPLSEYDTIDGLSIYAKEPVVSEKEERGLLSGSRSETVTILAEKPGNYELPGTSISWFNLETEEIETATVPSVSLVVTGGSETSSQESQPSSRASFLLPAVLVALACVALAILVRRYGPAVRRSLEVRAERKKNSERHGFRQLNDAIASKDVRRLSATIETWRTRVEPIAPQTDWRRLEAFLANVRRTRYDDRANFAATDQSWQQLAEEVQKIRAVALAARRTRTKHPLPPLNPAETASFRGN